MKEEKLTFDVFFLSHRTRTTITTVHFGDDQRRGCPDGDLDDVVRHGRVDWRNRTLQIWVFERRREVRGEGFDDASDLRVVVQPVGRFESV